MGVIVVQGLRVDTIIGVYGWERQVRQTLVLDIHMVLETGRAGLSDNLADTLDYSEVSHCIATFLQERQFSLIEAAAEQGADLLMSKFSLQGCRLRVAKPGAVDAAQSVSVVVERGMKACG